MVQRGRIFRDQSFEDKVRVIDGFCPDFVDQVAPVWVVGQNIGEVGEGPFEGALLEKILARYEDDHAPLLPVLQDINDECRYLPRQMLESVAQRLDIPFAEILRVASFYNAFSLEPVGRHVIEVCLGTACFVRGSGLLLQRLEEQIGVSAGGTDPEARFTLRTVRCIGCCALAPAMRIDGVTFGKAKLDQVPRILERFE